VEMAYNDPTWEWAEDGSVAIATFEREDGKETEKVKALASEGQITFEDGKAPTCEVAGDKTATAVVTVDFKTVSGETEFTATKAIEVPALGHVWGGWILDTEGNRYYRVCENDPEHVEELKLDDSASVLRLSGKTRYETSLKVADLLKEELGVDKFDTVIVASGKNFADALSGSYLAAKKNAPIIITNDKNNDKVKEYINANLKDGGTVYILGGGAAVAEDFEAAGLDGFDVKRLAGKTRYDTNIAILEEAGIEGEILVSTGKNYADSLSASSVGKPILLVGNSLTAAQKDYLKNSTGNFVILGGTAAVSEDIETALSEFGSVDRVAGKNRFETSVLIAEKFISDPATVVMAYSHNFPDGLCAGSVAAALKAPVILVRTENHDKAGAYVADNGLTTGIVIGGDSLISDESVVEMFSLKSADDIIER
ncbi:MAG: cell wall-binding repeat-containing protein, partial [Erysipelotrichaceae bacterium]|nr:cell wall-binding repeat-containing protein [Erysipelotrichaceae bacterium]